MRNDGRETGHETTVVIADDHAIVGEGFAALCASSGLRILGQASGGAAALKLISELKPDIAILDLNMPPGITGIEVIRQLRSAGCKAKLMILSGSREEPTVMEAIQAGADGCLLKNGPARQWQDAIANAIEGGAYVSPLTSRSAAYAEPAGAVADPLDTLSARELEVFSSLLSGLSGKDIAEALDISPRTVETYRASLMRKLNVRDAAGLLRFAIERNINNIKGICGRGMGREGIASEDIAGEGIRGKSIGGKRTPGTNPSGRKGGPERLPSREWRRLKLKAAIEQLWESSGVPRRFIAVIDLDPLPREPEREIKILLGRAVQEALSNIKEHAKARRVDLTLRIGKLPPGGDGIALTVRDDGAGFDIAELLNGKSRISWGIGLRLIREQASALGGSFRIESGPRGTTFEVLAPFTRHET